MWYLMNIKSHFYTIFNIIFHHQKCFVIVNILYFSCISISLLLFFFLASPSYESLDNIAPYAQNLVNMGALYTFLYIFGYALIMALISVTLPGMVFFPLSIFSLMYKAILLGARLSSITISELLTVFPVLILEGEAFVIAAFAGTIVGLSWIKPSLIYPLNDFTRIIAFKKSCKELCNTYLLVVLLLISTFVETIIIFQFT